MYETFLYLFITDSLNWHKKFVAPEEPQFTDIVRQAKRGIRVRYEYGNGGIKHKVYIRNIKQTRGKWYEGTGEYNSDFDFNNDIRTGETVEVVVKAIGKNKKESQTKITQFLGKF